MKNKKVGILNRVFKSLVLYVFAWKQSKNDFFLNNIVRKWTWKIRCFSDCASQIMTNHEIFLICWLGKSWYSSQHQTKLKIRVCKMYEQHIKEIKTEIQHMTWSTSIWHTFFLPTIELQKKAGHLIFCHACARPATQGGCQLTQLGWGDDPVEPSQKITTWFGGEDTESAHEFLAISWATLNKICLKLPSQKAF